MSGLRIYSGGWPVVVNERMAHEIYRLRFRAAPIAAAIQPGQFVMVRMPDRTDPLLGRAFALYDTVEESGKGVAVDIVYHVIGKMTGLMAKLRANDMVEVFGPLGMPFPDYGGIAHLAAIAGGIGQTPFLALLKRVLGFKGYGGAAVRREVQSASFYYGARCGSYLAGLGDFAMPDVRVILATDDGSRGHHGFVTGAVAQDQQSGAFPDSTRWVGCGPQVMMKSLAALAARCGVSCDLSLETPMACGAGICFSCVTRLRTGAGWDYRRVCIEGPVFAADQLIFD